MLLISIRIRVRDRVRVRIHKKLMKLFLKFLIKISGIIISLLFVCVLFSLMKISNIGIYLLPLINIKTLYLVRLRVRVTLYGVR